jgi:DNA topoisomerase-1
MLREFYSGFSKAVDRALEDLSHAKAETQRAPYKCPQCGSPTCYRFGKNGRFLSCTTFPECNYAAPIDRRGQPLLPERVDVVCPVDGSDMVLRNGRFGPYLVSVNYPATEFVLNLDRNRAIKYPAVPPLVVEDIRCPKCGSAMNLRRGKRGPWLGCSTFPRCRGRVPWTEVDAARASELERELSAHEGENQRPPIRRRDGREIPEGTPVSELLVEAGVAQLELHPDADLEPTG